MTGPVQATLDGFDSDHFVVSPSGTDLAGLNLSATISRDITQASTVTLSIADYNRTLLNSVVAQQKSVLTVGRLSFTLVKVTKSGNTLGLTFEDSLINGMRKLTGPISAAPGVVTRSQFAQQLAFAAGVTIIAQPGSPAAEALTRGTTSNPNEDTWACLVRLAAAVGYRCFSDGVYVYFGSDAWLQNTVSIQGIVVSEFSDVCDGVNFDYDIGKLVATMTVDTYAGRWRQGPGGGVTVAGVGAASGPYIVQSISREFHRAPVVVTLVAPGPTLPEPTKGP